MLDNAQLQTHFPNLSVADCQNTSAPTRTYNCIAWAAGDDTVWWEPAIGPGYYWPPGLPMDYDINTAVLVYEGLGYQQCQTPDPEAGYEKVVIYEENGEYQHAARQLAGTRWTSKLGEFQDIEHGPPDELAGGAYGQVSRVLKRPVQAAPGTPT